MRSNERPDHVFFIDRDLGPTFAAVLNGADIRAEYHDTHFPGAGKIADEVWLRLVAEKGWIGVSHDARIRYASSAKAEVLESGARLIVVKGKALPRELAENFVRTYSKIARFIARHPAPWIAKLYRDTSGAPRPGRIEVWVSRIVGVR